MKKLLMIFLDVYIFMLLISCGSSSYAFAKISYPGYLNTSSYIIVEYNKKETSISKIESDIKQDIENIFIKIENTFGKTNSLVASLNNLSGTNTYLDANEDFLKVFEVAKDVHQNINTFDVTIGTLSELWNISEKAEYCYSTLVSSYNDCSIPTSEEISEAISHININNVYTNNNQVMLLNGTKLDFGSIAKGYTADIIAQYLKNKNYYFAVINLGGNVYTYGVSNIYTLKNNDLTVSVENPFDDTSTILDIVIENTEGISIVTTGIDKRYIVVNDITYHHILDINTGYPIDNDIASITILNQKSIYADAYSTALYTLGLNYATEYMLENNISGVICTKNNEVYVIGNINYTTTNKNFTYIERK